MSSSVKCISLMLMAALFLACTVPESAGLKSPDNEELDDTPKMIDDEDQKTAPENKKLHDMLDEKDEELERLVEGICDKIQKNPTKVADRLVKGISDKIQEKENPTQVMDHGILFVRNFIRKFSQDRRNNKFVQERRRKRFEETERVHE